VITSLVEPLYLGKVILPQINRVGKKVDLFSYPINTGRKKMYEKSHIFTDSQDNDNIEQA